ncbi:MAG: putative metalloprotease CJM1_0395 family protein [Syntrophomonas sp.]
MRIESNSALENQYLIRSQEERPAKSLLEVQQIKDAWEVTDQIKPGGSTVISGEKTGNQKSGSGVNTSFGTEDKTTESQDNQQKMLQGEAQVRGHEAAHKAAAGKYAGPITYSYAVGPDGKRYIVGGEVSIHAPEGSTPEETIRIMEQVKRAALAPGDPSPQDLAVAAQAAMKIMQARQAMAQDELKEEKTSELDEGLNIATDIGKPNSDAAKPSSLQTTSDNLSEKAIADQEADQAGLSQEYIKQKIMKYQQLIQWSKLWQNSDYKGQTLNLLA